ncbi:NADP-dependent 3-hydroxy acid dehydrogenase YdfG [Variovorax boronicumulans]|nr:NADP-dependent 3-hydroxy acid dehydrogenase YdfG [Variovorax boronicumulans]
MSSYTTARIGKRALETGASSGIGAAIDAWTHIFADA